MDEHLIKVGSGEQKAGKWTPQTQAFLLQDRCDWHQWQEERHSGQKYVCEDAGQKFTWLVLVTVKELT